MAAVLNKNQQIFLESVGFVKYDNKYSGYYTYECNDGRTLSLIPYDDMFKMEIYEWSYDTDCGYYQEYHKEFSSDMSLEDFVVKQLKIYVND
jgi:hypothetical protein